MMVVDDEKLININDVLRTIVQSIDSIQKIKNNIDTTHIKNLVTLHITNRDFGGLR
jgi:hypothetical protein